MWCFFFDSLRVLPSDNRDGRGRWKIESLLTFESASYLSTQQEKSQDLHMKEMKAHEDGGVEKKGGTQEDEYYSFVGRQYIVVIKGYPGTTVEENKDIYGLIHIKTLYAGNDEKSDGKNDVLMRGYIRNLESSATGGFHLHAGKTCVDAQQVGGHWYDTKNLSEEEDPWKDPKFRYQSDSVGNALIDVTFSLEDMKEESSNIVGHAFVVHSSDGGRVGCGIVNPFIGEMERLYIETSNNEHDELNIIKNKEENELHEQYNHSNLRS